VQRAEVKTSAKDMTGTMADLDKAIQLDQKNVVAYVYRGIIKKNVLNDRAGAVKDIQLAARLYRENEIKHDALLSLIQAQLQELGASE
jgi:hypothetical protein